MKTLKKLLVAALVFLSSSASAQSIWGPGVASAFTTGSILFASGGVVAQNNAKLFWDNVNFRLGLGTAAPVTTLDVNGGAAVSGALAVNGTISGAGMTSYMASPAAIGGTAPAAVKATTLTGTGAFTVTGTGPHAIGASANGNYQLLLAGTFADAGGTSTILGVSSVINPAANQEGYGAYIVPTINKAGSGTHANFNTLRLDPPTIGAGAATLTNASTLKITGAPSVGSTKRALWVGSGLTDLGGVLKVGTQTGNATLNPSTTTAVSIHGTGGASTDAAQLHLGDSNSASSRDWAIVNGWTGATAVGTLSFWAASAVNTDPLAGGALALILNSNATIRMPAYGAGTATFDASGNITSVSDERMKDQIRPFTRGLKEILAIDPILHGYNKKSKLDQKRKNYAGFSAQNVQKSIPEAVGKGKDGYLSLSDRPLIAALVNAVKEQQIEIQKLKAQLSAR